MPRPAVPALLLSLAAAASAQDWPTHRGDLRRSGRTQTVLDAPRLAVAWTHRARQAPRPAWPGPARWDAFAGLRGLRSMRNYDPVFHPVAVGDAVWFGSSAEDTVVCLEAATGEERWTFVAGGPVRVAPSWVDGRLYFGADDGSAYCLDGSSGELLWRFDPTEGTRRFLFDGRLTSLAPVRTGVAVDGGVAYFGASLFPWRSSWLCALDAETGAPRFLRPLGTSWTLEGALALSDTRIVVPQGRVAPLVFDRASGAPLGSLEGGGGSFCLITEDDRILHGPGNKDGWVTDSEAEDRLRVASYDRGNAIVVGDEASFLLSDRSLAALHRPTKSVLWSVPTDCPLAMVLAGDTLLLGGTDRVEARRRSDGRLLWESVVEGRAYGLALARGRLFVATDEGVLVAFEEGDEPLELAAEAAATREADQVLDAPPAIGQLRDRGLLDRWVFQTDALLRVPIAEGSLLGAPYVANQVDGGLDARVLGALDLRQVGELQALALDGRTQDLEIAADFRAARMPSEALSVEAWVRVDVPQNWGGILGVAQDNGEYEKGWMLGFRGRRFGFAVNGTGGEDRLTWLLAPDEFTPRTWHHVVGTYDGEQQRLYVDGEQVASSEVQSGEIAYPEAAYYHLGAYRDQDEYFRVTGRVHEVCLYGRALSAEDVARRQRAKAGRFPGPPEEVTAPERPTLALARGPELRFTSPGEARLRFELPERERCRVLLLGPEDEERVLPSPRRREHEVILSGLRRNTLYTYRIEVGDERSAEFECDTHFDFSWPDGFARGIVTGPIGPVVDAMLAETGTRRGVILTTGFPSIEFAQRSEAHVVRIDLERDDEFEALVQEDDQERFERRAIELGLHGSRARVFRVGVDGDLGLPVAFANLMVVREFRDGGPASTLLERGLLRCLRPEGGTVYLSPDLAQHAVAAGLTRVPTELEGWVRFERGPLAGAGVWTHMYGTPDNSAFGGEALAGATGVSDLEVQWAGRPGPRYQSDRQNRKPSPLAVNGRLFAQGLKRVIAMDAYNGAILWALELPELMRFNVPRSSSNWCADADAVYLAMGDRCHRLDAATGDTLAVHRVPTPRGGKDRSWEWGFLAMTERGLLGSAVRAGGHHTRWWGSASWYDAKQGDDAAKVLGDALFLVDPASGDERWRHERGRVLESTITQAGEWVWFLEARHPDVLAAEVGRFGAPSLWEDLTLVALNLYSGRVVWERPAQPMPGNVAFCLAHADGRLVMVSSDAGNFALYTFDAATGESRWRTKFEWEADHHGKHLSRPAIVAGEVYLRPMVFDLESGEVLDRPFPEGHQCGTYVAAESALFLRAGELCVWDRTSGDSTRWSRLRPDCWISTIPACGMLLSPEGGGGCSCGSWIETSLGFLPRSVGD